ncbi:MAG TPA: hypothetical protein VG738_16550 [Chitinophagaceae bacterium]|nr:hypothetical protein [Chitinophagaceae bacterium]
MLKLIITCFIALALTPLHAQSDFLVLKKRHTSLHTYFKDGYISFRIGGDEWLSGYITAIQNDSVSLKTFRLQAYVNAWGMIATDTIYGAIARVPINKITAFPKQDEGFSYIKNGAILEIGAGGYMLLNIINTLSHKDPLFGEKNAPRLGTAAAVFAVGLLLNLTRSDITVLGKKYHLDYIKLNASSH